MKQSVRCHIASRQGWSCNVCGSMLPTVWHVDHITPLTDGGGSDERNLQALCAGCHRVKTSAEQKERAKMRRVSKLLHEQDPGTDVFKSAVGMS